jgi:hypothetical protein
MSVLDRANCSIMPPGGWRVCRATLMMAIYWPRWFARSPGKSAWTMVTIRASSSPSCANAAPRRMSPRIRAADARRSMAGPPGIPSTPSACIRKRIEEVFGWSKSSARHGKTRFRGPPRLRFAFTLTVAASISSGYPSCWRRREVDIADRIVGKWRIVQAAAWDKRHLDLCGPAFIEIDAEGRGDMAFGARKASLDCGFTPSGIDIEWNGADEGDQDRRRMARQ